MQSESVQELPANVSYYNNLLISWYEKNKRDLPWRGTTDPYIIWISEIILQQTRVNQGYAYFERFICRFPDVRSLADAEEDEVLKLWQGLGYYSRARNLHAAAKDVVERFAGIFPNEYKDVLSLKGIGEYTAAAIVSFAYDLPYAVVDGNVFRVLSRLFSINTPIDTGNGKKQFQSLAHQLLDQRNPATYNQAIMELGALQCVPVNPDCGQCPLNGFCMAYTARNVSAYPVKQGKTKVRNRYFNYLDIRHGDFTYLSKRTGKDIWENLYEFPLVEFINPIELEELLESEKFLRIFGNNTQLEVKLVSQAKHVLSHQVINTNFYRIDISYSDWENKKGYIKIMKEDIHSYPTSRLVHKYIERFFDK